MSLVLLSEEKIKNMDIEVLVESFKNDLCLLATSLYVMGDESKTRKAMMLLSKSERIFLSKHMDDMDAGLISKDDIAYFDVYINRIL